MGVGVREGEGGRETEIERERRERLGERGTRAKGAAGVRGRG